MANVFEMVFRAVDKATGPIRKISKATKGLQNGVKSAAVASGKVFAAATVTGVIALGTALGVSTQKAIAFESSMADVRKVVGDGFETPEQFEQFGKEVLAMSRVIPVAADGLAEISAEAAAAGIALEDNLRFTEFAAKSAVAFDTTAADIGEAFAKIRNVYQLNQSGLEGMSNAVNHLSNNMAAKAPQIIDFINRAGGAAPLLGATAEQMAAIGSSLVAVGVAPETAARGINALATRLEVGGKNISKAFKDIGLNYKEFQAGLKADPGGSLQKLFAAIDKSPKGTAALKELVGQDFVDDFLKLAKRTDLLAGSFELLGDKAAMAGSVQAEYEARAATTANNMQLLKNNIDAIAIAVGSRLLPPLNNALTAVNDFLSGLGDGSSGLEETLASAGSFIGDFSSSFAESFSSINAAFSRLGEAFSSLGQTVSSIFGTITGEAETFGTTLGQMFAVSVETAANVLAGITEAVQGGLAALKPTLTSIIEFVSTFASRVREQFEGVKDAFSGLFSSFSRLGEAIGKLMKALFGEGEGFAQMLADVLVVSLETFAKVLQTIVDVLATVIEKFAEFVETVKGGLEKINWDNLKPDFSGWELPNLKFWGNDAEEASKSVKKISEAAKLDVSDPKAIDRAARLTKEIEASQKAIQGEAAAVLAAIQNMVNRSNAILAAQDWTHHGRRMMDTLAAGMKARAQVVVDQIRATMQQVRDHLPSSPAKTGPLSDIDRLKFGETIARSIRPDPMVRAMRSAAAATRAAANDNLAAGLNAGFGTAPSGTRTRDTVSRQASGPAMRDSANTRSGGDRSGKGRGDIHINIPSVTLGGENMSEKAFEDLLERSARKVRKVIDNEDERIRRKSY